MVIALKNDDLEVQFKTFGGELSSIVLVRTSAGSVSDLRECS